MTTVCWTSENDTQCDGCGEWGEDMIEHRDAQLRFCEPCYLWPVVRKPERLARTLEERDAARLAWIIEHGTD